MVSSMFCSGTEVKNCSKVKGSCDELHCKELPLTNLGFNLECFGLFYKNFQCCLQLF